MGTKSWKVKLLQCMIRDTTDLTQESGFFKRV